MEISPDARSLYELEEVAKFLATSSADGTPNVALIISLLPVDKDTVVFGEFMMVKTKRNLDENPKVASLAITPKLKIAGFRGDLEGWIQSGPYVDRINNMDFFRYNAYAGIHNVGIIRAREALLLPPRISYSTLLADYASLMTLGRGNGGGPKGVEVPEVIRKKFNSIMSVVVLAFVDNGYPNLLPVMSTVIRSGGELRFKISKYNRALVDIEVPKKVALNVVTLEPTSYQIKGELLGFEDYVGVQTGIVRVDEVYSSVPPLLGERIA